MTWPLIRRVAGGRRYSPSVVTSLYEGGSTSISVDCCCQSSSGAVRSILGGVIRALIILLKPVVSGHDRRACYGLVFAKMWDRPKTTVSGCVALALVTWVRRLGRPRCDMSNNLSRRCTMKNVYLSLSLGSWLLPAIALKVDYPC